MYLSKHVPETQTVFGTFVERFLSRQILGELQLTDGIGAFSFGKDPGVHFLGEVSPIACKRSS